MVGFPEIFSLVIDLLEYVRVATVNVLMLILIEILVILVDFDSVEEIALLKAMEISQYLTSIFEQVFQCVIDLGSHQCVEYDSEKHV